MKWIVNDEKVYNDAQELAEKIAMDLTDSDYDKWLDNMYGDINICKYPIPASMALKRAYPIGYMSKRSIFRDEMAEQYYFTLKDMPIGEEFEIGNTKVKRVNDFDGD